MNGTGHWRSHGQIRKTGNDSQRDEGRGNESIRECQSRASSDTYQADENHQTKELNLCASYPTFIRIWGRSVYRNLQDLLGALPSIMLFFAHTNFCRIVAAAAAS